MHPDASRTIRLDRPLDLGATLGPLQHGAADPTMIRRGQEIWRATWTPTGPATLHLHHRDDAVLAEAWGAGAEWAVDRAPALIGEDDRTPFATDHPVIRDLHHRHPGLRFGRTERVFEAVVPAVCEQKVTGYEAKRAFRQLVERFGEPAPGPGGLVLPPHPDVLSSAGYHEFHPLGLERKRADVIRRAAARAGSLEAVVGLRADDADDRLRSVPGIGPWTAAWVRMIALGDADAVLVGDYHVKHDVVFAFTGRRHGTDSEMLDLLEPFRGHRARVVRLLHAAGMVRERHGPRMEPNDFANR